MAAWDNLALPSAPAAREYQSPLVDFSPLSRLYDDFFRGTQQKRELELQKPINASDPGAAVQEALRRGGAPMLAPFLPFLQQQQASAPSPIFGGGGAPSPALAPGAASSAPSSSTAALPAPTIGPRPASAAPVYSGGDQGQATVAAIAAKYLPEDNRSTGQVIGNVARAIGADPNAPLSEDQQAKADAIIRKYAERQGIKVAAVDATAIDPSSGAVRAPGTSAPQPSAPASAAPQMAAAPAPREGGGADIVLPPGFNDPKQAIIALRKEAARLSGNPYGREQAKELSEWANRIETAAMGPRQFGIVGHDENGLPAYGFINPYTQTVRTPGGPPAANAAASTSQLTGQDYLDTLDQGRAAQIKAIVEGRMQPPNSFALKAPQMQALLRQVAQYDPGFDLTVWKRRHDTQQDFSSKGKSGQNLASFNTTIGHLDTLDKAATELNNSSYPAWNNFANWVNNNLGDPRVKKFEIAKTAVADELTRSFRGSGGNVHDIVQWEKAINSAGSPEQLKAAIRQAVELLHSRIEAVGDNFNRGMDTRRDAMTLLSEKAQKTVARIMGEDRQPAAPDIPAGAVELLKKDPKLADQFDAKYGAGSAARVLGR